MLGSLPGECRMLMHTLPSGYTAKRDIGGPGATDVKGYEEAQRLGREKHPADAERRDCLPRSVAKSALQVPQVRRFGLTVRVPHLRREPDRRRAVRVVLRKGHDGVEETTLAAMQKTAGSEHGHTLVRNASTGRRARS